MAEKTAGLARASCSTKGHIRHYCTLGAKRSAQSEFKLFVPQLPPAWQSQGRESMRIDVQPSKFRKNLICPASPAKSTPEGGLSGVNPSAGCSNNEANL